MPVAPRQFLRTCILRAMLLPGFLLALQQVAAADCVLTPLEEQLQIAELRTDDWHPDEPEYAEKIYRKRLLRFVNAYYSNIADDVLRGEGDYLAALDRLMGSDSPACVAVYKSLLIQEVNSQDFGIALWTLRVQAEAAAQTSAVPLCENCEVSEMRGK